MHRVVIEQTYGEIVSFLLYLQYSNRLREYCVRLHG